MTREEAIAELSVIWERLSHPEDCENGCYSFRDGDYLEALDMAIEALQNLSKPNNGLQGSDLISRSRAIEGIREYINEYKYNDIKWAAMKEAEMLIESLPSEDAVEVVRCGRCEWWKCNPNTEEYGVCKKVSYDGFEVVMNSDDFCSYGEDGEA